MSRLACGSKALPTDCVFLTFDFCLTAADNDPMGTLTSVREYLDRCIEEAKSENSRGSRKLTMSYTRIDFGFHVILSFDKESVTKQARQWLLRLLNQLTGWPHHGSVIHAYFDSGGSGSRLEVGITGLVRAIEDL